MYQQPFQPQHFAGFATHQQAQSLAGVPQNNGHYQPNHHHHQHQIPVHMQSHGNGLILDGFDHATNGQLQPQIQAANAAAAVVAMTSAAHHLHSQQAQQAMSHLQPPQPIFITTDVSNRVFCFLSVKFIKSLLFFLIRAVPVTSICYIEPQDGQFKCHVVVYDSEIGCHRHQLLIHMQEVCQCHRIRGHSPCKQAHIPLAFY